MSGCFRFDMPMWAAMLITRMCALGPAVAIALAAAGSPGVQAQMNEWLNVLQSVQLPFALIPVLSFTSRPEVMGEFVNSMRMRALCWVLALLILGINVFLIYTTLPFSFTPYTLFAVTLFVLADYAFILYLSWSDVMSFLRWTGCVSHKEEEEEGAGGGGGGDGDGVGAVMVSSSGVVLNMRHRRRCVDVVTNAEKPDVVQGANPAVTGGLCSEV